MRRHWVEYGIEAAALGLFMMVAAVGAAVFEHPASPVRQAIGDPVLRRVLTGLLMGATLVGIVYSPWGTRSGAHLNPAFTLTFYRLGKVGAADAIGYSLAQFVGGAAGTLAAVVVLAPWIAAPEVNYVATVPGPHGITAAFAGEIAIAFVQMTMVLNVASRRSIARFTGVCAGGLVALYISVEAPLSGMSLNPARSLAPAWFAGRLDTLWIYFVAPLLGMGLAAELHVRTRGLASVLCAKLHHRAGVPCPFNCTFHESSPCPPSTSTSSSSGPAPAVAR